MAMQQNPRGRQFEQRDYSRPVTEDANSQEQALSVATDVPGAATQPTSNDSGHWSQGLPQGVDAGWVKALHNKLVKSGVVSMADIQADKLGDPEHRKWLNRKLRKHKQTQTAAATETGGTDPPPEGTGEGEELETGGPDPAAPPRQTVIPSGRLPKGRIVRGPVRVPAGRGFVPAGEGLWWPPYPTTGGPIARPELARGGGTDMTSVLTAAGQETAIGG